MNLNEINAIKSYLLNLQKQICCELEAIDGSKSFLTNTWERPEGGGGCSRVLEDGAVIERGGVNFSHVYGENMPASATAHRPELAGRSFQALGVSLVIHPRNPYAPTSHMNVRFFMATKKDQAPIWWFGGGFDLTPYYGFVEDCVHWHQIAKQACEPFGEEVYPQYKKWCDEYFYLKHRQEPRGIGGLFFDDVNQWDFDTCFSFQRSIGNHFMQAYGPILQRRKDQAYSEKERAFQNYRRGRYVEFNLVFDRGTLFGLQSNGRTEAILVSMPPIAHWQFNYQPESGSQEEQLYKTFLKPCDWLSFEA